MLADAFAKYPGGMRGSVPVESMITGPVQGGMTFSLRRPPPPNAAASVSDSPRRSRPLAAQHGKRQRGSEVYGQTDRSSNNAQFTLCLDRLWRRRACERADGQTLRGAHDVLPRGRPVAVPVVPLPAGLCVDRPVAQVRDAAGVARCPGGVEHPGVGAHVVGLQHGCRGGDPGLRVVEPGLVGPGQRGLYGGAARRGLFQRGLFGLHAQVGLGAPHHKEWE
jgi:hypothetical protein